VVPHDNSIDVQYIVNVVLVTHPFHIVKVGFFGRITLGSDSGALDLDAMNVVDNQVGLASQKVFVIVGAAIRSLGDSLKAIEIELPLKRGQLVHLLKVLGQHVFCKHLGFVNHKAAAVGLPGDNRRGSWAR